MRIKGRRLKKDKRKIKSRGITIDGIKFKSKLEGHMYVALKEARIEAEYEPISYQIMEGFHFPNKSFERQSNGKGDMIDRGGKKVLGMKYTPDFVGDGFVVECKGFGNDSFPIRWKIFKKYCVDNNLDVSLYMPRSKKECEKVAKLILEERKSKNT